jgi:uncharacterized protein YbaR (Trm112 family)
VHHALLEVDVVSGSLVCTETGRAPPPRTRAPAAPLLRPPCRCVGVKRGLRAGGAGKFPISGGIPNMLLHQDEL